MLAGLAAVVHYSAGGLTLSHYDARGHLVVARRIIDSITPGWQQIGAVWLPLPHLLNALPVQADAFYRTGASAVALSVLSHAIAAGSIAWMVMTIAGSRAAAAAAAALFALDPNLLYLQATPMTEPLLLALTTLGVALLLKGCSPTSGPGEPEPEVGRAYAHATGIVFALACLTRYEAWPITAAALVGAAWATRRRGALPAANWRALSVIARYPLAAVAAFFVFSRVVVGEWFVSGGFFVPDNAALGRPLAAAQQVLWGARTLGGIALSAAAAAGIGVLLVRLLRPGRPCAAIPLALLAGASLPWLAFLEGHPFRIRYMTTLLAGEAVAAGVLLGLTRRAAPIAALALVAAVSFERPPLDRTAAMVLEAQWDAPNAAGRRPVGEYLRQHYRGETIMASMGSLGHYMQALSGEGFALRDFLHEGNGDIWLRALEGPRPFVGWILIEEQAEGGDMLAGIARENPSFLEGFSRVSDGGGVALYARQNLSVNVAR
jgi:hypothetical protein